MKKATRDCPNDFWLFLATLAIVLSNPNQAAAQSAKTPPWVADAPGEFVRLIDRGNVKIVVDDDLVQKAGKSALTIFKFNIDYDFKYRHQTLSFDRETNAWQSRIVAWMDQPKVTIEHKICLKSDFHPESPWESNLLRHEFDHVAISSDPRMLKIMKQTLRQRRDWTEKWIQSNPPSEEDVRESILGSIASEVSEMEKLVQSQYDILDHESSQGMATIQARTTFFRGLYTLEGIEKCKYNLTPTIREFVKQKLTVPSSMKDVESHYLFLVP